MINQSSVKVSKVTVNLEILRKIRDNRGYCLCKVDEKGLPLVACPCEEAFNLKEGKECTCGLYKSVKNNE